MMNLKQNKNIIIFTLLFMMNIVSINVYASFQYEIIKEKSNLFHNQNILGSSFYINVTQGSGTIYIADVIFSDNQKINDKLSINNKNENNKHFSYGYIDNKTGYIYKSENKTFTKEISIDNKIVNKTFYELGNFNQGDQIGIWIKNNNNNIVDSILNKNMFSNKNLFYRNYGNSKDILNNYMAEFYSYNSNYDVYFVITDNNDNIKGQPLPGIIIGLLIGILFILFQIKIKYKKI